MRLDHQIGGFWSDFDFSWVDPDSEPDGIRFVVVASDDDGAADLRVIESSMEAAFLFFGVVNVEVLCSLL
jgi:hypothetical protein